MNLPEALRTALETRMNTRLKAVRPVSGGDINQAAQVSLRDDVYFLKWNPQSIPGMFAAEARGLTQLAQANAVRIPQVILLGDAQDEAPDFLLLEYIPAVRPRDRKAFSQRLGEGVAALHQHSAAQHGLDHDNFIGSLPQSNAYTEAWPKFYREQRIRPQMDIAQTRGRLPAARRALLEALCERLTEWVPPATPALLHGDLWSGNYMATEHDEPVLYDPAVYYGHHEVEIAFTELFGGFSQEFYAAYEAVMPLDDGYAQRKALYQLYPLMVHMNLFGGGYAGQVDAIARQYTQAPDNSL